MKKNEDGRERGFCATTILTSRVEKSHVRGKTMRIAYHLFTLSEHALVYVGAHLPFRSAMALSRTCRKFRRAFPAILRRLDDSHDASVRAQQTRVTMGPRIDGAQLATMAAWMRVYDITLVVSPRAALRADDACATMRRWVASLCRFAGFAEHWAPARWAEIDGTWTRIGPDRHAKTSFPARWLRLDLSPTFHPDKLVEVLGMGTEFPAFKASVVETSRLNRTCITDGVASTLRNVHTLDLRYTSVSDAGASALGASVTLHTLSLRGTMVTDVGAARLRNVRSLDLGETGVTDAAALELSLGGVQTLDLSETAVTDVGAVALSTSRALRTLSLRGTMVTDVGAAALGNSQLHTLDVSRTGITAVGAAALRSVRTLTVPDVSHDAGARETEMLRAWVDATFARVPLCERWADATQLAVPLCENATGTDLDAIYAAYRRADPPVHERTLSQISFKHMLGEIHTPRPVLGTSRLVGAAARRVRYAYPLRSR